MADNQVLKLSEVPRYTRTQHSTDISRATVYNWVKTGVGGTRLKFLPGLKGRTTRKEWVDAFVIHLMSQRTIGCD